MFENNTHRTLDGKHNILNDPWWVGSAAMLAGAILAVLCCVISCLYACSNRRQAVPLLTQPLR